MLDTNILISACLKPGGLEAEVVTAALDGRLRVCVTEAVLAEYRDVLFREKFRAVRERAGAMLAALLGVAERVTPGEPLAVASDEDDNRFLECAAAAAVECLITGNLRHYPAEYGATRVVNARMFALLTGFGTLPALPPLQ